MIFRLPDVLLTLYYCVVILVMLNLLIAMINHTYEKYTYFSQSILLIEKYNILYSKERYLSESAKATFRLKYSMCKGLDSDNEEEEGEESLLTDSNLGIATSNNVTDDLSKQKNRRMTRGTILHNLKKAKVLTSTFDIPTSGKFRSSFTSFINSFPISDDGISYFFEYEEIDDNWLNMQNKNNHDKSSKIGSRDDWSNTSIQKQTFLGVSTVKKSTLFIIDPQIDFHEGGRFEDGDKVITYPRGSLCVPGSNEDSHRIAEMIINKKNKISDIYVSLDSHYPTHIAHSLFWIDMNGNQPEPFIQISNDDILHLKWFPRACVEIDSDGKVSDPSINCKDKELMKWCLHYTR